MNIRKKIYAQTDAESSEMLNASENFEKVRAFYRNAEEKHASFLMHNVEEDKRTLESLIERLGKIRNKRIFKSSEEVSLYYKASQLESEIRDFYGRL